MIKDLVSILVPCYNGGKYLGRFFDSIYNQTYKKLQIIIINDGSTDNSAEVILKYQKIFQSEYIEFINLSQKNQGQAVAVNTGIPYIKGEFLMWVDCDDFLEPEHVDKKVRFLKSNTNLDVVICKGNIYNEDNMIMPIGTLGEECQVGSIFEDVLFTFRSCQCGLYMVRSEKLLQLLPEGRIYVSPSGQNMQMLLPILAQGKVGYINDRLYNYIIRDNSHSHSIKGGCEWKKRNDVIEDMKLHVLETIPLNDAYRKKVLVTLSLQMKVLRLSTIDDDIAERQEEYVKSVCNEYIQLSGINKNLKKRKVYVWGTGKRTEIVNKYLTKFAYIPIEGYIDSDLEKEGRTWNNKIVLSPESINKENMFILIPLAKYYPEIVEKLYNMEFQGKKDFFYPQYEIYRSVKERKNEYIF